MEGGEPMVYMNVMEVRGERIVAICDSDLLGLKLVDGERVLHVDPRFYGGQLVPISVAMKEAKAATIVNLVGENSVSAAVREGIIHPMAVVRVAGVPHAQAVRVVY